MAKASVTLFKDSGKYYISESWEIPEGAIGPSDMAQSPDFRRIGNGKVLVDSEPAFEGDSNWGFPRLL